MSSISGVPGGFSIASAGTTRTRARTVAASPSRSENQATFSYTGSSTSV
jgi:hypothetical protein